MCVDGDVCDSFFQNFLFWVLGEARGNWKVETSSHHYQWLTADNDGDGDGGVNDGFLPEWYTFLNKNNVWDIRNNISII